MSGSARLLATALSLVLFAAACTPGEPAPDTTLPAAPEDSSTTSAPPQTSEPATTTSTAAIVTVSVASGGDLPPGLEEPIALLYSWLADDRNPEPDVPADLLAHVTGADRGASSISAAAAHAELPDGSSVAVVKISETDILLAADEGQGWRIVGAKLGDEPPWAGEEPRLVLVLGSDARPGQDQQSLRADSIHILSALPTQGTGAIVGVPRDSYVDTPFGRMKISSLMASRGPEVMLNQVREDFEVPVEGYLVTGFRGFEDLMRDLGRLPIDLPRSIPTQQEWPGFRSGQQEMSPIRVLEYARTRKQIPGGDFGRSENQGFVMLAVLQLIQQRGIESAPGLLAVLMNHVWTDLTAADLIQLAGAAFALDPFAVPNVVLPGRLGRGANNASVVLLDPGAEVILAELAETGLLPDPEG